jgi:bifunctional DNase/RNase
MPVEVKIAGLALDEKSRAPIVVLKDETGNQVLPIVIGIMEASAIAAELEGVDFPRPMTHDLLNTVITDMGGVVEEVEVSDLINDTFYAILRIRIEGRLIEIDARPSDSIALALRAGARILVNEKVFQRTSQKPPEGGGDEDESSWKDVLENLDDDDFGKYKM